MVVAVNRYVAEDVANLIDVEYDPLDTVWDVEKALTADTALCMRSGGDNLMQRLSRDR